MGEMKIFDREKFGKKSSFDFLLIYYFDASKIDGRGFLRKCHGRFSADGGLCLLLNGRTCNAAVLRRLWH